MKALFDGDCEIPDDEKVIPTGGGAELVSAGNYTGQDPLRDVPANSIGVTETLTIRGELNKLASNMALGRNRVGIHYRSDGIEGLRLGERAAIQFMEDQLSLPTDVADLRSDGDSRYHWNPPMARNGQSTRLRRDAALRQLCRPVGHVSRGALHCTGAASVRAPTRRQSHTLYRCSPHRWSRRRS